MSAKGKGQTGHAPRTVGSAAQIHVQEPPIVAADPQIQARGQDDLEALRARARAKRQAAVANAGEEDKLEDELAKREAAEAAVAQAAESRAKRHWPKGEPLPTHYQKRPRLPCPKCRRVAMDDGSQAAIAASIAKEIAFLRCRECGHRWQLPVA